MGLYMKARSNTANASLKMPRLFSVFNVTTSDILYVYAETKQSVEPVLATTTPKTVKRPQALVNVHSAKETTRPGTGHVNTGYGRLRGPTWLYEQHRPSTNKAHPLPQSPLPRQACSKTPRHHKSHK